MASRPRLRSLLWPLALLIALNLLTAARLGAQGGQVTLIRSSLEPLPPCTPATTISQSQPQVWDITAQKMMTCTAVNTWTALGTGGGGGGTITGSGTANTFTMWTANTAIGNAPMSVASGVTLSANPFSVAGPLLFPCTNAASGTTQGLLVTLDSNSNCINLPNGNTGKIAGVCFSGCGTSGTAQIAVLGTTPITFDNQTAINDYIVAGTNGQAHDAGASYPTGVQVVGIVATVNGGTGTSANANITILNVLNPTGATGHTVQVNGVTTAGVNDNFNGTTPAAQANFFNLTFQNDNASPTSNISVEVPVATTGQQGIVKLAQDLGGTSLLPTVQGIQTIPVTFSGIAANDTICFPTTSTLGNCHFGVPVRTVSGNSDTILPTDRVTDVRYTAASGATAVTMGSAASFGSNITMVLTNAQGTGTVTVTPTTSTINGASTLVIPAGNYCFIYSDNTNYFANCGSTAGIPASVRTRALVFSYGDPGGVAITASGTATDYMTVPFACTIAAYNILVDAGTVTIKFWKVATGTAIPTSGNSINTSGVSISSGTAIHSTTLSDFTSTAVSANDIMAMNITTVATAKFVSATLECDQ